MKKYMGKFIITFESSDDISAREFIMEELSKISTVKKATLCEIYSEKEPRYIKLNIIDKGGD